MPDRPDFDLIGDLLPAEGAGSARSEATPTPASDGLSADLTQRLAAVWAEVVGDEVAQNARPAQLRGGRLVVTTSSSAWAQTLQLMSEMVIARLNERLGTKAVEKAVFRHAGWEDFPQATAGGPPGGAPSPERRPRRTSAPGDGSTLANAPAPPSGSAEPPQAEPGTADPPAVSGDPSAAADDDLVGFSDEEKQALADLERLPLTPSIRAAIRHAMKAGFVRARQDSGR